MNPRPRIRKTVMWGGLALTAMLVSAWTASMEWVLSWENSQRLYLGIGEGRLGIGRARRNPNPVIDVAWTVEPGWHLMRAQSAWPGNWFSWRDDLYRCSVGIPLWMLVAPAACATAAAWRQDALARRRARIGRCSACGYDLRGLPPGATCPECGADARMQGDLP